MLGNRERILTPEGGEHAFADACFALSAGARLAVLQVLLTADGPIHIREVARRVGVDPSPVRTHLDVLVRTGFAREIPDASRERRFAVDVSAVRLVLTPPERPVDALQPEETKAIRKITEKIRALEAKAFRLEQEIARLADDRMALWMTPPKE